MIFRGVHSQWIPISNQTEVLQCHCNPICCTELNFLRIDLIANRRLFSVCIEHHYEKWRKWFTPAKPSPEKTDRTKSFTLRHISVIWRRKSCSHTSNSGLMFHFVAFNTPGNWIHLSLTNHSICCIRRFTFRFRFIRIGKQCQFSGSSWRIDPFRLDPGACAVNALLKFSGSRGYGCKHMLNRVSTANEKLLNMGGKDYCSVFNCKSGRKN